MNKVKMVSWCLGFYRFTDSKTWQRTQLEQPKGEEKLREYLNNIAYIDKSSIIIHYIELPE